MLFADVTPTNWLIKKGGCSPPGIMSHSELFQRRNRSFAARVVSGGGRKAGCACFPPTTTHHASSEAASDAQVA